MNATIRINDETANYEVIDEYGDTWEAVHASGTICVCETETSQGFECGVFFGDHGKNSGTLHQYDNGEIHEIDNIPYEATSTYGWKEVEVI